MLYLFSRKSIYTAVCFLLMCFFETTAQTDTVIFKKHILSNDFISEGVAVGDVNNDGKIDVLAGDFWFEAPNWKKHTIANGKVYSVKTAYANSFLNFSLDVNLDGWVDHIVLDFPGESAFWYENPKGKDQYWKQHVIYKTVGNESPAFEDVDGDGRKDLIFADPARKQMAWMSAPTKKGDTAWTYYPISEKNVAPRRCYQHGLGWGDMNNDGRADLITVAGWWAAPLDPKQSDWEYHPGYIGEPASQMFAKDVNGDGKTDVISASAHKFGIWWHEQTTDDLGQQDWAYRTISFVTSQTHAVSLVDLDGDGSSDFVTGKRYFAHLERANNRSTIDPGTYDRPILVWFKHTPGKAPFWKEIVIDDDSGVGINIVTQDIIGNKKPDIIIANKKGVFVFESK
ncbi:FG-GAP-like repeat-containing protein [Pollutibacter soli]|uniref:FG-GAP-like repeat-containing protein n=1 Tax=Pollutibacter soli TaxID=3034157 RepID=UPI003013AB79